MNGQWLMMLLVSLMTFQFLSFKALANPVHQGDPERGKTLAEVRCAVCHHLEHGVVKVGPGLKGIFNRPPSISGVPFERWDSHALDRWLLHPRKIKPNTRMIYPGLASERDRRDVIAYLRTLQ